MLNLLTNKKTLCTKFWKKIEDM